jgi:hypothetical protein
LRSKVGRGEAPLVEAAARPTAIFDKLCVEGAYTRLRAVIGFDDTGGLDIASGFALRHRRANHDAAR